MAFLKRLFRREKPPSEPMHGSGAPMQTEAEQDITRQRMEAEMASQRDRRAESTQAESEAQPTASCIHSVLLPRWDSIDDMGHEEKATSFVCEACGQVFTAEEGRNLKQTEAERLPQPVEETDETSPPIQN